MRGIYVHVPFCVRKCAYCDFYSVPSDAASVDAYCRRLAREARLFRERCPDDAEAGADTIFFGGGTPTVLGPDRLGELLSALAATFPVRPGAEISVEANPGTVSRAGLAALVAAGFTRVSVGVQSFDRDALRTLGRIHDADSARRAVRDARDAGAASVGVDLIFGIPGQTAAAWEADVARAVALSPDHVSAYALAPEPGTPIQRAVARGELTMPPDDEVAEMYEAARTALSGAGIRQYEISNFAVPGRECRHNVKYWTRDGYVGLGPSAHGLLFPKGAPPFGVRTENPASLDDYGRAIDAGRLAWSEARVLSADDAWKESLIAGLRLSDGIDLEEVERRNGPPPAEVRRAVEKLVASGTLLRDGPRLRIPPGLFFVSNEVLSPLA